MSSDYQPIILSPTETPIRKRPISQCQHIIDTELNTKCDKPLGAETKQYNVPFCKEHRICITCQKEISLKEVEHCISNELAELKCSRCLVAETSQARLQHSTGESVKIEVTQKYLDELNMARLLMTADLALSDEANAYDAKIRVSHYFRDMDFDQMRATVKKMQAVAAEASLLLQRDKRLKSAEFKELRQRDADEKAVAISKYNSEIDKFMVEHNILDRERGKKLYAKHQSQQAKKTASHFAKQASKVNEPIQETKPPKNNLTPEERKHDKSIRGLMESMKCSYELASKTLDTMMGMGSSKKDTN